MHYLSVDIEGMSGFRSGQEDERNARILREHVLAAAEGMRAAGETHIRAKSFHGLPDVLPPYVEAIRRPVPGEFDLPRIDASTDGLLLLGFHGLEPECGFGHAYRFPHLFLNGEKVGEIAIQVTLAAAQGVPTVFLAGDRWAVDEVRKFAPEAVTVCEREGGEADEGEMRPRVLEAIRSGAGEAVRRRGTIPLPCLPDRYLLEAPMRSDLSAEIAERLPYPVRRDGRTVSRASGDFAEIYGFLLDLFAVCNRAQEIEREREGEL